MDLRYERPASVEDACGLLARGGERTRVLAGGTDLVVDLRHGLRPTETLVDIKAIGALLEIDRSFERGLRIGACVSMQRIAEDPGIRERYTALAEAAAGLGSRQIRSRATLGGNLCNCSPCADTAPALIVLEAEVEIAGPEGDRILPIHQFARGVKKNALGPGEILRAVRLPCPKDTRSVFRKVKRIQGPDLALVSMAGRIELHGRHLRAAVGSAAPTPVLLPGHEVFFPRGATVEEAARRLFKEALEVISPIDDVRASAAYRKAMIARLCREIAAALVGPGPRRRG